MITASSPKPSPQPTASAGFGTFVPSAYFDSTYYYVFFATGLQSEQNVEIHVARATPGPSGTTAPTFHKWYNGGWGEDGVDGRGTPILDVYDGSSSPKTTCGKPQRQPGISWNRDLGVFFLTFVCDWFQMQNGVFTNQGPRWFYATSFNLETQVWTEPLPILPLQIAPVSGVFPYHPTLINPLEVDQQTTRAFNYVYYSLGTVTTRQMHYRSICMTNTAHQSCP